jgi:divalent metal cation (Fe/Co/Zn/Cd) transporter
MPGKRIVGLLLIVAGAFVLWQGWQTYQSVGSRISRAVQGGPSSESLWMLGLGIVLAVAGIVLAARG